MATEKIFYQDPFLKKCKSRVMECRTGKYGFEIRLDRTVFYPEGGGQPWDTGTLNQVKVIEVHEKEGEIWHDTQEPLEVGAEVEAEIDWDRRFDLMQQHSGEHIVSGWIHTIYGYNNVGFHIGAETVTIDFDGEIPMDGLDEIEKLANQYVWENHPIEIAWPSSEELENIPYRSKKELSGAVRIVTWPGADICACCGVHVMRSGDVGQIAFLSSQRFRGGVRIEMICGMRTQKYLHLLQEQNRRISQLLSAKWKETYQAVEKLYQECQQAKFALAGMEREQVDAIVKEKAGAKQVLLFESRLSMEHTRKLATDLMDVCDGMCAVFSGNDTDGYHYFIGEKAGDLRALAKEINTVLQGRGGGKPYFIQGAIAASHLEIEKFFRGKMML